MCPPCLLPWAKYAGGNPAEICRYSPVYHGHVSQMGKPCYEKVYAEKQVSAGKLPSDISHVGIKSEGCFAIVTESLGKEREN